MEWLLQIVHFTFDHMLIIQNPYGEVPLSSMLVFETDEKCLVQYIVRGKTEEDNFSYCTKAFTRQHMIPVLGLYAEDQNIVEVTLYSGKMKPIAKRNLTIVTGPLPEKLPRQYGIYLYEDGHFMFPDRKLNSPTYINPHSNVMYEMDFTGRTHEVFHVSGGIHHCLTPRPKALSGKSWRPPVPFVPEWKMRSSVMIRRTERLWKNGIWGLCFPENT